MREDDIKTDVRELCSKILTWIELAQDRIQRPAFLNNVMNVVQ
jgi:hypothetical protein